MNSKNILAAGVPRAGTSMSANVMGMGGSRVWPEQCIIDIARWILLHNPDLKPSMVIEGELLYNFSKKLESVFNSGCIVIVEEFND